MTDTIYKIKRSANNEDIKLKLTEFLMQDDVPQICYCFLQRVLVEMGKERIFQHVIGTETREGKYDKL